MDTDAFLPGYPAFVDELAGTLAVQSQFVLHGNLRDLFLVEPPGAKPRPVSLLPLLWQALQQRGYSCLICYDPVDGIAVYPQTAPALAAARSLLGSRAIGRRPSLEQLRVHLAKVVGVPQQPPPEASGPQQAQPAQQAEPAEPAVQPPSTADVTPAARAAFVIDYAARITRVPGQLDPSERDFFLYCQKLALTATPFSCGGSADLLFNPVIWLVEGERDLPAWLTAGVEPIRTVALGMPTLGDRERFARLLAPRLPPARGPVAESFKPEAEFARRTEGMTLRSMTEITRLSVDRGIPADRIADAARIYRLGISDNPWQHESVRKHVAEGQKRIGEHVVGQERAIGKTIDILKRAALGLSGAQATSTLSRPRGVLFFAGPTGVGKTELAKRVAELLFGDVNAYLRFDMSEFGAEHAADRLAGAPPGYVGFEAGGELTGAVRRNPFQVVLFDEIEKAHPKVLDKFLQILEDGRLTDGQGVTTHFSECVLIFTSNLGVLGKEDPVTHERKPLVEPGTEYPVLEARIKEAVRSHFAVDLGRPELLNRLGDNIVVFNFIRKEQVGEICRGQLGNIVEAVRRELGVSLTFTADVRAALEKVCAADLSHGARGIGNILESNVINPLAAELFDRQVGAGARVEVSAVRLGNDVRGPELDLRVLSGGRP